MNNSTSSNQQAGKEENKKEECEDSAALKFLKEKIKTYKFVDWTGINNLPFVLYDAVAKTMEEYAESLPQSNNKEIRSAEEIEEMLKKNCPYEDDGFLDWKNVWMAGANYFKSTILPLLTANQFHNKEEVNEDELWQEAAHRISRTPARDYTASGIVSLLKQHYSLKKK